MRDQGILSEIELEIRSLISAQGGDPSLQNLFKDYAVEIVYSSLDCLAQDTAGAIHTDIGGESTEMAELVHSYAGALSMGRKDGDLLKVGTEISHALFVEFSGKDDAKIKLVLKDILDKYSEVFLQSCVLLMLEFIQNYFPVSNCLS